VEHKTLFKAYGVLEDQLRIYDRVSSPFSKLKRSRNKRGIEWRLIASASPLPKELKAAKKKSEMIAGTYL
jgi:TRIAD3 protein (E3 ubiquitin-protein ligase RNF216)